MFAVVGTMISAVVMAAIIFGLSRLNVDLVQHGILDFLIFGAIMSATDPVATLAIFGRQNADPTLFSLVFGESVLNDAVAITFFKYALSLFCISLGPNPYQASYLPYRTLVSFRESIHATNGEFTAGAFFEAVGSFMLLGLGSTLIGVVFGAITALILRRTLIKHHPPMEILFIISFAYATYVLSDGVGLSGIVAIFFFGIATRHYTYYNLSDTSKAGSMWLFTCVSRRTTFAI
jgi:solute carrier family 9 (sodium/hydrogen exchanger), member 6/7